MAKDSPLCALSPRLPLHLQPMPPPRRALPWPRQRGAEGARPQGSAPGGTDQENKGRERV